jgi:hypothetical protein
LRSMLVVAGESQGSVSACLAWAAAQRKKHGGQKMGAASRGRASGGLIKRGHTPGVLNFGCASGG